ncbi:MAG: NAD(P)-dependent oxidoreductase [Planctomycetes bacterium RBG_16_64_10]|nr:MAG: NAD(P)-dependent oxidoreductase [Planctomycetes bacterium RBG_16_64_10]
MRCLIIGGDGMLGHQLLESWRDRHEVRVTLRRELAHYARFGLFTAANAYPQTNVRDGGRLQAVLDDFRPHAVINAAGIIKQRADSEDVWSMLQVNALFPHRLEALCQRVAARLVHISTDCVFSGRRGNYRETDPCDAHDLYGLSKYLGELHAAPAVTLRTSIVGLELATQNGLVEWFLAQRGDIQGFTRAIYSGVTTIELARVIDLLLGRHRYLTGLWHVASSPIAKHALLSQLAALLGRTDIRILPCADVCCDRSLDGTAFAQQTGYQVPSWDRMLAELAAQIQTNRVHYDAA